MPLQIRRGSTAQRLTITPLPGELIYDTTTGQLFVGDGTTVGGATTTGVSLEDARDAAAGLLTSGVHSGITFTYNDTLDRIDATVTIGGTGPFDGDINGSVFADDSTLLVDATSGQIRGSLNVSGSSHSITTSVGQYLTVNNASTKLLYTSASGSSDHGISLYQHANSSLSQKVTFVKSRGTEAVPTTLSLNDTIGEILFGGYDGVGYGTSARIRAIVSQTPTGQGVRTLLRFAASDGANGLFTTAILGHDGVLSLNGITSLTGGGDPVDFNEHIFLRTQKELRFGDADSSNYLAFKAPNTVSSNVTWTLPATDGASNQILITDGSGNLSWSSLQSLFANPLVLPNNTQIANQNQLRFMDADNSNYVAFVPPNTVVSNVLFQLPGADGAPDMVMTTNGNGNLSFQSVESLLPTVFARDIKGSIYGDDSTLLVDATLTGKIVGPIDTSSLRTSENEIRLGALAGNSNQGTNAVAVGATCGQTNQGNYTIAIGYGAGNSNQGQGGVALGQHAGQTNQGLEAIAIGYEAGNFNQLSGNVAVGAYAGSASPGQYTVALGFEAGKNNQGNYGVAIGYQAGKSASAQRSIIINATTSELVSTTTDSFFVKPIRQGSVSGDVLRYDPSSGEITYTNALQISYVEGDVYGSVIADNSLIMVDAIDGNLTGNKVQANTFFKLPVYADDTARLNAIPTPAKGMMIFMESGTTPAATNVAQVFDGTNWVNI